MPNQGYPEDSPAFPGREPVRELDNQPPLLSQMPPFPAVHVDQTTADRVAAARKVVIEFRGIESVADGILKNAAGSTAEAVDCTRQKRRIREGVQQLQNWITEWAVSKGWLVPGQPRELLHQLMLVVSELSEACEAHREGNPKCTRPNMGDFSHVEEELADAVIRILQIAGEHNFRVVEAIIAKMEFNETRPVKHGKLC